MSADCANIDKAELNYVFEGMQEAVRKCRSDTCTSLSA